MLKIFSFPGCLERHRSLALTSCLLPALCAVVSVGAIVFPASVFAAEEKLEFPSASARATVKQRVGLTDVEVDYSRPNKNNRDIFGGLVPFDKPWRTGANQPTKIKTSAAVKLGEKEVPAGEYVLYTIPGANEWTIVLSKNLKAQGLSDHKPQDEVRGLPPSPDPGLASRDVHHRVRGFAGGLSDLLPRMGQDPGAGEIDDERRRKGKQGHRRRREEGKPQEAGFYYSAASFYLDQNKDLPQALKWVDQALEKNPKAYFMHQKRAQILAKMGNKKEAIASAEKAIEILQAEANPDTSAIGVNRALIDSLR